MKRATALLVLALIANLGVPATAGPRPRQQVQGTILLNPGERSGLWCDIYDGIPQALTDSRFPTGIAGYSFWLEEGTQRKPFRLVPDDPATDLDIFFHTAPDSLLVVRPPTFAFRTRKPGGETGTVPPGFHHATICAQSGVNVSFTYTAGTRS